MTMGALAFLNPWLLAALASLPVIYWLLRTVPPRPKQIEFPPTRILVGIENIDKQPAKTPWWLMLIRLLAAALVIFALAEPILNPSQDKALQGSGPVVIALDNGWTAAPRWTERQRIVERIITEAETQRRAVVVLATASAAKTITARIEAPSAARSTAAAIVPQPFAPDRIAAVTALDIALAGAAQANILWLADGIDHGGFAKAFADRLVAAAKGGSVSLVDVGQGSAGFEPLGTVGGVGRDGKLEALVLRAPGPARDGSAYAFSVRGQQLGEARFTLGAGETSKTVAFELPLELRNQVTRIELAGERSAGAVSLLDARSQWQRIGLISGENREQAQPLLAPLYYIQKALAPFAEIVRPQDSNLAAGIDTVLKRGVTVLVLADIGTLAGEVKERVDSWVRKGGVLIRFAGPRLEKGSDDLLPVPLRLGGRTLGGALSWSQPQPLAAFEDMSLFAGLPIPADVLVNRQVLADPSRISPESAVWARLKDGTPLVTSGRRGQGQLVLFHITANSDWSNLPISGLFVEMLQRVATLGRPGAGGDGGAAEAAGHSV
ncbi:MAG: BatA domain-containing protein, partial [Hyphomicrobium sp.]